jgi:catechol 2,3-dioxygenase-like lactoylglutathione lyase family enzyme
VADLQRSLDFYEGKLGFKRVYVSEEIGWAELSFGAHRRPHLGLNRYTDEGEVPCNVGGIPSFEIQDMEALKAEVERLRIQHQGIVDYSEYFQFLWIFDPDGNKIEFVRLVQGRMP